MVIDFHSHVLPGIDDGSKSVEQSVEMLQMLASQGVSRVIATPHFYPQHDSPEAFLAKRQEAEERLRREMKKYTDLPELIVGAEVYYYRGISESDALPGLTIGKNKCILIEMPMVSWTEHMYRDLADIYEKQGLIPIIAHIDRYIRPMHASGIVKKLEQLPVCVQANAEPFLRYSTRRMMLRLLRNGQIHLLGSDCHDLDSRKPNIKEAVDQIRKHLGEDAISYIQYFEKEMLNCEDIYV